MAKRTFFQQQTGERKKAKLDVSISDHNFPLSQNGPNKEQEEENWGDDNDDEILLLASQACEDAYNDISSLPDYSLCMQPGSTSTQLFDPGPSTSKTDFTFKKPSAVPNKLVSTDLKDKCNRISSPLPGISSKIAPKGNADLDSFRNYNSYDKIYKGQESEQVYKQLLQLQEENNKLKSENGRLLEKCVTKEGEASILRTQLKSCQMAVDNARMEKIKAQEKVQMEWNEKLVVATGQMHELRTQLDFKNLEIISIKERCKMLESNKVKLTQVNVSDMANSHRNNSILANDLATTQKRVKMSSNSVQTDDKTTFPKLNKTWRSERSEITPILPLILEPTKETHSILEYNEKLQKQTDLSHNKCRIYSTFHRLPSTPVCKENKGKKVVISCIYENLTNIAAGENDVKCLGNILSTLKSSLEEVHRTLELISQRTTTAFQREMDEAYIELTSTYLVVNDLQLLGGSPLYKEEQAILARRLTALFSVILKNFSQEILRHYEEQYSQLIELIQRICSLLDNTSCALFHSGLLLSFIKIFYNTNIIQQNMRTQCPANFNQIETVKSIISSRPMHFVSSQLLDLLRKLSLEPGFLKKLCPGNSEANLRLDYDQGVLLYKKDSCYLQILLKQIEASLKCIEQQKLTAQAVDTSRHLMALYSNLVNGSTNENTESVTGCECQIILLQVIVYALRICAVMLKDGKQSAATSLQSCCLCGVVTLYGRCSREPEFSSRLGEREGMLIEFCQIMRREKHPPAYENMLTVLSGTFLSPPEETTPSYHRQSWINSFQSFAITD